MNKLCVLLGHSWRYKDYSQWMKENGEAYDFKMSRFCNRCNQHEYLYTGWVIENKNTFYDIQGIAESIKEIPA